jgi:thiamin-phosphate kinase
MVEAVHFNLEWLSPAQLGARALTVNLSDIAAMGGTPRSCVINLGIRAGLDARFFDRLYQGLGRAARIADVDVVGGNITRCSQLTITIALLGEVATQALRRDTARQDDDIFVTGTLGDSALLWRESFKRRGRRANTWLAVLWLPRRAWRRVSGFRAYGRPQPQSISATGCLPIWAISWSAAA